LRPLIHEEGKSASELSRKDEIFTSDSGLISIAGGKLTGYRKMAERTVDRVARRIEESGGKKLKPCKTDRIPICGNDFKNYKKVKKYITTVEERLAPYEFPPYYAWYLVTTYGIQTEDILTAFEKIEGEDAAWRLLKAELHHGVEREMVQNPMDFCIRRTGRLYFDINSIRRYLEPLVQECGNILKADSDIMANWREDMEREMELHSNFSLEAHRA
jgi:glycerol-3-phosphate dehydrogenase